MSRIKLALIMPWRENKGVANLNGIYTDGLGLPVGKKSLEEIFVKIWPVARNNLPLCLHKHNL
ncbi:hypothetical protein CIK90_11880 [Prevotella sp. P5-126]|nr:hypothetical protein CIK90_11880 [Prevotella sp. P5-126]